MERQVRKVSQRVNLLHHGLRKAAAAKEGVMREGKGGRRNTEVRVRLGKGRREGGRKKKEAGKEEGFQQEGERGGGRGSSRKGESAVDGETGRSRRTKRNAQGRSYHGPYLRYRASEVHWRLRPQDASGRRSLCTGQDIAELVLEDLAAEAPEHRQYLDLQQAAAAEGKWWWDRMRVLGA